MSDQIDQFRKDLADAIDKLADYKDIDIAPASNVFQALAKEIRKIPVKQTPES